jgi:hypothetical protein
VVGTRRSRGDGFGSSNGIRQDALRRNPHHPEPVFLQKSCPRIIALRPISHLVSDAIDFDDQPFRKATKVDDVGTDGMLPPKLESTRPQAQLLPQQPLRNR